ncbi:MAG: NAD(P)/FAD-dependent oxidoreductase [Chloroflexi bacterium]|nr:MAG: NAD(P)/FAD-dependent oxidoreductase [Chloroflexota bacterium]
MTTDADVIVVGAGPVGSALATMLGLRGLRTLLIDQATFPRDKPCGEGLMPAGAQVLEELGVPLDCFPPLGGVSYRVPSVGCVAGSFSKGRTGRGTRRLVLDRLLAEHAAATPNVELVLGCRARAIATEPRQVSVQTTAGSITAKILVGADGRRSQVGRLMGWQRPPRARRYALVGHLQLPAHEFDGIVVTLLRGCEVYLAPTSRDEVLVALLGPKAGLKAADEPVRAAYRRHVAEAHPELAGSPPAAVRGAGPFWSRPSSVAGGRVFLVGDAAGFLDPLTGDGMAAGLVAARRLASTLAGEPDRAAARYRRWEAGQWRRRVFMSRLALGLTRSSSRAGRAIIGLTRSPATFSRLLEVNDGSRSPLSLTPRDWAALAGI